MPIPIDTPLIADGEVVRFARSAEGRVRLESWRDGAWIVLKSDVSWATVMAHAHPATADQLRSAGLPEWHIRHRARHVTA